MTKHTPTPWIMRPQELDETMRQIRHESSDGLASVIATTHNATICEEHGGDAILNAEFIVRAANNFQSMLDALKLAADVMYGWGDPENQILPILHKIIAKAEGK